MKNILVVFAAVLMAATSFAQEQVQTQSVGAEQKAENDENKISNDFKFVVTTNAVQKREEVSVGTFKNLTCKVVVMTDMSNAQKEGFITFKGKNMYGYLKYEDIYPCYDAIKLVKNELQPAIYTHYLYKSSTDFVFASELENKRSWYWICVSPKSDRQEFNKKEIDAFMGILEAGYAKIEEMLK